MHGLIRDILHTVLNFAGNGLENLIPVHRNPWQIFQLKIRIDGLHYQSGNLGRILLFPDLLFGQPFSAQVFDQKLFRFFLINLKNAVEDSV